MKAPLLLLLYVGLSLAIGGLLAYPIFYALQPWFDFDFDRVTSRALMLGALICLPLFLRALHANRRNMFGEAESGAVRLGLKGFAAGIVTIIPLLLGLLVLGVRVPTGSLAAVLLEIPTMLVAAALIGLIEEAYFRGAILGTLLSHGRAWAAILISSLLYASVHFLRIDYPVTAEGVTWYSGLLVVAQGLERLTDPRPILDAFLALFAAGMVLGWIRYRLGHVAVCVGLHAGWVLGIQMIQSITEMNEQSQLTHLVGALDGVMGYLAVAWICLLSGLYWLYRGLSPDAEGAGHS